MQDSTQTSSPVFSGDSLFLIKKGDFPFAEHPAPLIADTAASDVKKKFIESQIKTKVVEIGKKAKTSTSTQGSGPQPVSKDTALFSITLQDSASEFRFKDIVPHHVMKKEAVHNKYTTTYKSLFGAHELRLKHDAALALNRDNSLWVFFVLFVFVGSFAWIKVFYAKTTRQVFQALLSMSTTNQMVRDENLLLQRASVLLTFLFNLVAAFYIYQVSLLFEWSSDYIGSGFGRFLIFALVVSFVYSFKFIILKLTGYIFRIDKPFSGYIFNIFLINNVLGIVLLPLVIAITFLPSNYSRILVLISLCMIFVGFFFRILRGLLIGISYAEFSKFYLLLYLCALEISPLLIIVKLFVS